MKVIQLEQHGEPDLLKIADVNTPEIENPTEIRVKLKAASVNPIDSKLRAGEYPIDTFPAILGCDAAGIVEQIGINVTRVNEGDEVYFFHGGIDGIQGNYAEYKVLDERFVALKPKSQNFTQAAAAPLILLTAWEALFDRAHLAKDKTVFINAGAGGVGHVAIQIAKQCGAQVCTTVSNEKKAAFVKDLGADFIINYKEQDLVEAIMEWTNNQGVEIAMDNVGGAAIQEIFPAICHCGELVTLLQPDNSIDWSVARFSNIRFSFEVMLSPLLFNLIDAQIHQTWILEQCAKIIDNGNLQIHVSDKLSLEEAAKAHRQIETGHTMGKIILNIQ